MFTAPILLCLIAGALATNQGQESSPSSGGSSSAGASSSASASSHAQASSHKKLIRGKCGPCPDISVDPIDFNKISGAWYEIQRSRNNYDGSDRCYKLTWSFTYRLPTLGSIFKEHLILQTDYQNYTIVYSCEMRGKRHYEYGWVFSRQQKPTCDIEKMKQEAYARYNLTVPDMVQHDLSGCCEAFANYKFCE
ncbi:hypothetical protein G9C98_005941 [Cotesia typhae]|uniref:Lipocalin/cytosolic fatty-acid binding domain-containing protein n=1 Tax=Cotesia typhae TaxID=2053667 RepID=A0A8J5QNZ9_9HYME|nr:hypothetical protein G9C98_005941 [Cotesia typhae]